jgi:uncharacterized membrane protein
MNKNRRNWTIVGAAMAIFVIAWTTIAVFKYLNGGYNGLDLAIYNNVFWNTVHGRLFASSIHPPSYLGDHAEWYILPLAVIYAVFPHPLTLVVLQILVLAFCAVPIYLIAKNILAGRRSAVVFPIVWLLNFTVCYNALWEFHMLVFALPFVFFTAYYFIQKKYWQFLLFLFLAMLAREDVAFVALGFALVYLAGFDSWRKGEKIKLLKWALVPVVIGAVFFFADIHIITGFNASGVYKYVFYYHPLGNTLDQIFLNTFSHPLAFMIKISSFLSLKMFFVALLPFSLIPLRRPRFLLLSLPSFIITAQANNRDWFLPLETHYAIMLLPGIAIAAIYGFQSLLDDKKKIIPAPLITPLLVFGSLYFLYALGPLPAVPEVFAATPDARAETRAEALIPPNASVSSSFAPATALSGREKFYYFNDAWFGKNEFAYADYSFPEPPDYLLINERFFLAFAFGLNKSNPFAEQSANGDERFRKILAAGDYKIIFEQNNVVLLKNNEGGSASPFINLLAVLPADATNCDRALSPGLALVGYDKNPGGWKLYFKAGAPLDENTVLKISGEVLPFGQGVISPEKIPVGKIVEYSYSVPAGKIDLSLFTGAGSLVLLRDETAQFQFSKLTPLGQTVSLP